MSNTKEAQRIPVPQVLSEGWDYPDEPFLYEPSGCEVYRRNPHYTGAWFPLPGECEDDE